MARSFAELREKRGRGKNRTIPSRLIPKDATCDDEHSGRSPSLEITRPSGNGAERSANEREAAEEASQVANSEQTGAIHPCPWWKRAMDVVGAGVALALLSPVLLAAMAAIKLGSRGPIFFRQQRYGLYGRPFLVWKFRTFKNNEVDSTQRDFMLELMESERPMVKRDRQLAIIPGGRLMRKLGIDELPQLINVLKGEMSLVGPRPHVVPFQCYEMWQRPRFDVLPGITGLWQVSGKEETTFSEMMHLDIDYVGRRSMWLDVRILLQTIPVVFWS